MRTVDKFNDFNVTAFAGVGDVRLMMLHKCTSEESIRLFFQVCDLPDAQYKRIQDIYHMLVKILMNPFYEHGSKIRDPIFERAIREVAKQRLSPTSY
jgi:hypothetical protein